MDPTPEVRESPVNPTVISAREIEPTEEGAPTTVTTTTQPIRNKIKDIRGHLKNHGPLRSIRNILRGLFNRDITPDPNVKEVVE